MSRLMADQENRCGDGDPGTGEDESVMGVNLAEGGGTVNAVNCRLVSLVYLVYLVCLVERN